VGVVPRGLFLFRRHLLERRALVPRPPERLPRRGPFFSAPTSGASVSSAGLGGRAARGRELGVGLGIGELIEHPDERDDDGERHPRVLLV